MNHKRTILTVAVTILWMSWSVACGGRGEEAGESIADLTATFQSVQSEAIGVTVGHPADWVVAVDALGEVQMASDPTLLEDTADDYLRGALVAITSLDADLLTFLDDSIDASDPVSALTLFASFITGENEGMTFTTSQAATAVTVAGKPGARMGLDVSGEQGEGVAYLTAVLDNARIVYIFGAAEESVTDFDATYTAIVETLQLTAPAVTEMPAVEPVADMSLSETAAEPEPMDEPEPTMEPEPTSEPDPEPTAVPAPTYVSIDVDPGFYLYTSGDFIRDMLLFEDQVWIASLGGVLVWDAESGTSRKYTTLDGLPHVGIYGITACPTPEMTIIVGTEDGLAAYDSESDSWYPATDLFAAEAVRGLFGLSGNKVGTLICDTVNNQLIMEYRGVTTLNLADGSSTNVPSSELSWSGVRRMNLIDNRVWVSSGYRGYTIIDGENVQLFSKHAETFDADTIYHIAAAPNGDIWMAASEGLLQVRNNQVIATFNRDNTANFSTPYAIAFDPNGAMWLGMTSRICQFDPASGECRLNFTANQTEGMLFTEISQILFDDAGNLYYHVFQGGWGRFDGNTWQRFQENEMPIHAVQTIFDDSQGNIWMLGGTAYTLHADLELKQGWERIHDMGGEDIVVDSTGSIWLAWGRNLYQYDGFEIIHRTADDGLLDAYARVLAVDNENRIWIGQDDGLSIWDGQAFITITTAEDDWPEGRIQAMLVDGDVLWVGTNRGLIRYADGVAELVLHSNVVGLPSPIVNALAKLPDGRLLIGTGAGLAYYDHEARRVTAETAVSVAVSDLAVSFEGEIFVTSTAREGGGLYILDEEGWLHLTTADGLITNQLRTLLLDSAGTLWVGGGFWGDGGGLMRFVP